MLPVSVHRKVTTPPVWTGEEALAVVALAHPAPPPPPSVVVVTADAATSPSPPPPPPPEILVAVDEVAAVIPSSVSSLPKPLVRKALKHPEASRRVFLCAQEAQHWASLLIAHCNGRELAVFVAGNLGEGSERTRIEGEEAIEASGALTAGHREVQYTQRMHDELKRRLTQRRAMRIAR